MDAYSSEAFGGPEGLSVSYKSLDLMCTWGVGGNFRNLNFHFLCSSLSQETSIILQINHHFSS